MGVPRGRRQPLWWTLRRPYRPLTYHGAHRMFERVNASLGADWTLHDLRHSCRVQDGPRRRAQLTDVQWVIGHAHLTTTEIYLTPTRDEVIEGVLAHHARQSRAREAPPPQPAPGYDPRSLSVLFGQAVMTAVVKHKARTQPAVANASTAAPAQPRNSQLRRRFPPVPSRRGGRRPRPLAGRACCGGWPRRRSSPELARRPGRAARGTAKLLRWLSRSPGDTWQQRWEASRRRGAPGQLLGAAAAGLAARATACGLL